MSTWRHSAEAEHPTAWNVLEHFNQQSQPGRSLNVNWISICFVTLLLQGNNFRRRLMPKNRIRPLCHCHNMLRRYRLSINLPNLQDQPESHADLRRSSEAFAACYSHRREVLSMPEHGGPWPEEFWPTIIDLYYVRLTTLILWSTGSCHPSDRTLNAWIADINRYNLIDVQFQTSSSFPWA